MCKVCTYIYLVSKTRTQGKGKGKANNYSIPPRTNTPFIQRKEKWMPWVVLQARISLSETIYVYSKGNNHCVMVLQRLTASILPWHWITTTSSSLQAFVCTSSPQPVVRTWRKAMTYSSIKLSVVLPRVDVGVGQSKCFPQKLNPPSFNPGGTPPVTTVGRTLQ